VAERIGSGDYDAVLEERATGELGALASAFRSMVSQIRAREEESRRAARALRDSEARFRETGELPFGNLEGRETEQVARGDA